MQEKVQHINVHIADRIRKRRLQMKLGLRALGEAVGVTAQQIQKYESGRDRIFASRLFLVAGALRVPIGYFYKGLSKVDSVNRSADDRPARKRLKRER